MLKELREALKAETALVAPIRQKIQSTHGRERYDAWNEKRARSKTRRYLHLACCFVRSTSYRKCEAHPVRRPDLSIIQSLLVKHGCTDGRTEDASYVALGQWLDVPPVAEQKPPRSKIQRLYTIVRADLPPGSQAVQAAHAMREFAEQHPEIEKAWHAQSNTLAMLAEPDETTLAALVERLRHPWGPNVPGFAVAEFREPDLGGSLTAICVEPRAGRILRDVPLALQKAS